MGEKALKEITKEVEDSKKKIIDDNDHLIGDNLIKTIDIYLDQYYLTFKKDFKTKESFRDHLISIFTKYSNIVLNHDTIDFTDEVSNFIIHVEETFDKIVYHGRENPVLQRLVDNTASNIKNVIQ